MRRQLLVLTLLVVAACSNDPSASSNDAGLDAPSTSPNDAGGTDAASDAAASDAGCLPCIVSKSTVGNCCLQ